ncbi:class I SAM-dependent methyltransferase family protein [Candidatus Bathyarchaeota archaeon]|nr:class I SAM-dependent methyltransferase family protein [Candidatus Bathyarchaeota archaeon]
MRKRLRNTLFNILSSENIGRVYCSFDVIGDIAIIKASPVSQINTQNAAEAIMSRHRNVKTVLLQAGPVAGDLRLRRLIHVAGKDKTTTVHSEFGCLFAVDVEKCYFSPRLSYERMRIAKMVESNEVIVNMFAGVGCFSIIIAKHAKPSRVFSLDVNPAAIHFMQQNIRLNRVYDKITPLMGDSKEIINNRLQRVADRVLMPLPEKARSYLPYALSSLKATGGWIHYYGLEHANKAEKSSDKIKLKVTETLDALGVAFEVQRVRVVRSTGPNWFQLVADVQIR